jgi:stearoyl-CoA desaturase (Delta-9 desaturase)
MGEGYHNFHHQFPMDYRNAFFWYQYDPTKWFIALCSKIGLASHLRMFPSNEISKGQLAMKLKELKELQDSIKWPTSVNNLPIVSWETCQLFFLVMSFLFFSFSKKNPSVRPMLPSLFFFD